MRDTVGVIGVITAGLVISGCAWKAQSQAFATEALTTCSTPALGDPDIETGLDPKGLPTSTEPAEVDTPNKLILSVEEWRAAYPDRTEPEIPPGHDAVAAFWGTPFFRGQQALMVCGTGFGPKAPRPRKRVRHNGRTYTWLANAGTHAFYIAPVRR